MITNRNDALLSALPGDLHLLRHEIEIAAIDSAKLRESHARRVEQLEDREVTNVVVPPLPRAHLGRLEHEIDLCAIEIARQILLELRGADRPRRVRVDDLVPVQKA